MLHQHLKNASSLLITLPAILSGIRAFLPLWKKWERLTRSSNYFYARATKDRRNTTEVLEMSSRSYKCPNSTHQSETELEIRRLESRPIGRSPRNSEEIQGLLCICLSCQLIQRRLRRAFGICWALRAGTRILMHKLAWLTQNIGEALSLKISCIVAHTL